MATKDTKEAGVTDLGSEAMQPRTHRWPELTRSKWEDTRETLHLWTQIVGKVRLALAPMINHWWQVPLYVSARGLTTSLMHAGGLGLETCLGARSDPPGGRPGAPVHRDWGLS